MCERYFGRLVAITGFKNGDISDDQYAMFLKYAWSKGCKVHCLGMTRTKVLDKVPFDFTDSSSWKQESIYGRVRKSGKVSRSQTRENMESVLLANFRYWREVQQKYYQKWRKVCND